MPTQGLATSYDEVPYPWLCYRPSHPSHLFVCATLLGLSPAPAETCRVLELGCALGGNLLPMAASLPGASFVGIDLSPAQIASGQQAVDALGLRNVSLQTKDLSDVTPALGTFDYIIAHGIYSWVPPTVRDHLLRVCHENLAPNGVAYVSYNTLPGWHMILSLREMMLHHARTATDPLAQAALARELIAFLAEATADEDNPIEGTLMGAWRSILRVQNGDPRQQVDAALLHDELAQWNDPVYFYQFVEHAGAHGLQFLVEADWHLSVLDNLPAAVASRILDMSTNVGEVEQYMDYVRNRAFRRTLLCQADIKMDRTLRAARARRLAFTTRAHPMQQEADHPHLGSYADGDGTQYHTDDPLVAAALDELCGVAPQVVPFATLVQRVAVRVGRAALSPEEQDDLALTLTLSFARSPELVELHGWVPPIAGSLSERPLASPWARWAAFGNDRVANLRHESVHLDSVAAFVLRRLDGQHTARDLTDALEQLADQDKLHLPDPAPRSTQERRARIAALVQEALEWLQASSLLLA